MTPTSGGSATGSATIAPSRRRPGKSGRTKTNASGTPRPPAKADRGKRDPEAAPQRQPLVRPRAEGGEVGQRPALRAAERLEQGKQERIADQPGEQQRQPPPGEAAGWPAGEPAAGASGGEVVGWASGGAAGGRGIEAPGDPAGFV